MDPSQGNTMEQYTTLVPLPQGPARSDGSGDDVRVPVNSDEPSRAELLVAIQGSRVKERLRQWRIICFGRTFGTCLIRSKRRRDPLLSYKRSARRRSGAGWRCGMKQSRQRLRVLEALLPGPSSRRLRMAGSLD
ncbi:hypothetical protein NDU88_001197 [Pleurodeles waltl]|uniref:Uncharacterized protein n=1 Tax=Pleurodeles waltl TaxID=8319 RepID=A0AAV7RA46_PLEWA|nr:hypothetical protein NDU88_001197 [Pleurodeles waltl]